MNMTLWKRRSPINGDLDRLRDEMDQTFERFLSEPFGFGLVEPKSLRAEGWVPPLDVSETDSEVTIRAELPGIAAKDLDVSVSNGVLTIAGQKEEKEERTEEDFFRCERRFGSFRRTVALPDSVDADKVTAEADNGVVTIHVAKKPEAKPRQVEVKLAGKKVAVAG